MRRRLVLIVVLLLAVTVVVAAPASAKKPLHGDQVMLLNQLPDGSFGLFGCPGISWFGEVEIDGETYGMSLYPDPDTRFAGKSDIMLYVESWKICSGEFSIDGGVLVDCTPGDVVLQGKDHGVADFGTGVFHSNGKVTNADEPFDAWMGRKIQQRGTIGLVEFDDVVSVGFPGTMRLN